MPHTFVHMAVHVVFGTKDRATSITPEMKAPLYAYMGGIIRELNAKPLKINGTGDHVHVLIGLPASISLSELVRVLKTNSSRWAHEKWPDHAKFGWQQGYGAFSVSRSSIEDVESTSSARRSTTASSPFRMSSSPSSRSTVSLTTNAICGNNHNDTLSYAPPGLI